MGPETWTKDLEARKKKLEEMGSEARRTDVEAQNKKRKDM